MCHQVREMVAAASPKQCTPEACRTCARPELGQDCQGPTGQMSDIDRLEAEFKLLRELVVEQTRDFLHNFTADCQDYPEIDDVIKCVKGGRDTDCPFFFECDYAVRMQERLQKVESAGKAKS